MSKTTGAFHRLPAFFRAFLFLALVFLLVGFGTLGSVRSTGGSFELTSKTANDEKTPCVVFELSNPEGVTLRLKQVYLNIGGIYTEEGEVAEITLTRAVSATAGYSNAKTARLENFSNENSEQGKESVSDALFNWIAPFEVTESAINTYNFYKLTAGTCSLRINEVVFVGEEYEDNVATGRLRIIPAKVYEDENVTVIPYDFIEGEPTHNEAAYRKAVAKASRMLDAQQMPSLVQSSFFRYGTEEIYSLLTIAEMRAGDSYTVGSVYHGDRVYNALGSDILALGTAIFGISPFGLRFFPMLASFGVLVVGYCLVKLLTGSEKAGFFFALVYALCNYAFGLGHLGTPLMIGVFFFLAAVYFACRFYLHGIGKASGTGLVPVTLAGAFAALSICVNGAYAVLSLGVVVLFALGMVRQLRARRERLDKAIAEAEASASTGENGSLVLTEESKRTLSSIVNEYRRKNVAAPLCFFAALLLGTFFFSIIFLLPVAPVYIKLFDNPASPVSNLFTLAWQAFAGGFTGTNAYAAQSAWSPFYTLFCGTGETFAVTAAIVNPCAALVGLGGIGFGIVSLVRILKNKERRGKERARIRMTGILLAGLVLSLIVASFAGGGLGFILLAYLFAFMLGADYLHRSYTWETEKERKFVKAAAISCTVLLAAGFLLFAVLTFSIPLPASFIGAMV